MNNALLLVKEKGLSGIARKVLECTPLSESWLNTQIIAEMERLGSRPDHRVVMGCLKSLCDDGLVRSQQTKAGVMYTRVGAKPKLVRPPEGKCSDHGEEPASVTTPDQPVIARAVEPQRTAIEKIASISTRLSELAIGMKELTVDLDELGIKVDEQIKKIQADTQKLRQLQALLKSIGD